MLIFALVAMKRLLPAVSRRSLVSKYAPFPGVRPPSPRVRQLFRLDEATGHKRAPPPVVFFSKTVPSVPFVSGGWNIRPLDETTGVQLANLSRGHRGAELRAVFRAGSAERRWEDEHEGVLHAGRIAQMYLASQPGLPVVDSAPNPPRLLSCAAPMVGDMGYTPRGMEIQGRRPKASPGRHV